MYYERIYIQYVYYNIAPLELIAVKVNVME